MVIVSLQAGAPSETPCQSAPCQHGGTCLISADGHSRLCQCVAAYTGDTCQSLTGANGTVVTVADLCSGGPCYYGATCTSDANTFTCHCPSGYTGLTCQNTITQGF